MPRRSRRLDASAVVAFGPVVFLAPFCLLALFVIWLPIQLVWDVAFRWFAFGYAASAVVLFVRPVQALVLTPLFGARRPTADELAVIDPRWSEIAQANRLPPDRYFIRVLPSDELNAFACGGHLVVVTTFAVSELPAGELAGVLAHELSHHLGLHTVALTLANWLSLPVVLLARIGFFLQNVATAATRVFAAGSSAWTIFGQLVAGLLNTLSLPFVAALVAADAVTNLVSHSSEFRADRRVVGMGYGRNLALALRRVVPARRRPPSGRLAGSARRLAPPARTRIARIEAMLRHPAR